MDKKYIRLPLKSVITLLQEKHYNNPIIAKKIGVTSLQVHYYHRGKTLKPSPMVCMKIFNNFVVEGDHILVDIYKDYSELENHYKLVRESSEQNKQSTGSK
jgi:transcriptional regulator with XRE-family HTH domain